MAVRTEGQRLLLKSLADKALNQRGLARLVDRSEPTVSLWVSGENVPDVVSAARLEDVLGIPPRAWASRPNGKRKH